MGDPDWIRRQVWTPAGGGDGSLRGKVVPMIADAMRRAPLLGLQVLGWDFVHILHQGAIVAGVVVTARGVNVAGPDKELCRFEGFSTWSIDQATVDEAVGRAVGGLREFRAQQMRGQS